MTEQNKTQKEQGEISPETHSSSTNSRRSFLTKAVVAAPILSSLASKPVWAIEQCTISGMLSGNLSTHDETCNFGGLSPGYWKNHTWPFTSPTKENTFEQLFGVDEIESDDDGFSVSLINVINTGGGVTWKTLVGLNRHMVATACNFAYASYLNTLHPGGITAVFDVRDSSSGELYFSTWAEVQAAYAAALHQFKTEDSGGNKPKPVYTLAETLAIKLASSYHQYETEESYGTI